MVGFHPEESVVTNGDTAIAGAISGTVTRVLIMPLDVVKIRFQLQLEEIAESQTSKYHGVIHAFRTIIKEEKVTALWRGHVPGQFLSITYGLIQFSSFEFMTRKAWELFPAFITTDREPLLHLLCGSVAGCLGTFASMPFDVVRTRLVSQGEPPVYKGPSHAVLVLIRQEGPSVFFRGWAPAVTQIAPYSGLQFGLYSLFSRMLDKKSAKHSLTIGWLPSLISGLLSGTIAKIITYPFDVSKHRLQVQGPYFEDTRKQFGRVRRYTGFIHCLATIIREEGFLSLYKGFAPTFLKAAVSTGLTFCFYEKILQLVVKVRRREQSSI